jgi:hypothetical protein
MGCHGCSGYRPAQLQSRRVGDGIELDDDTMEGLTLDELRAAYKQLRAHHIEETTALWDKYVLTRYAK